jgi:prepilin-type N-terminal cleavage/methylation domain-containing protein
MGFKDKRDRGEEGFSLLEMTIATAIVLTLTTAAGVITFGTFEHNQKEQAVNAAVQVGYAASVNAITDFDEDTTVESSLVGVGDDKITFITLNAEDKDTFCLQGHWFEDMKYMSQAGNCEEK